MKVTLWKSLDGKLHETHAAYLLYLAKAKIVDGVKESPRLNFDLLKADGKGNQFVSDDDIPEFIASNAEEIYKIIGDAIKVKRVRASIKAPKVRKEVEAK